MDLYKGPTIVGEVKTEVLSIFQKINKLRTDKRLLSVKKTGENKFSKFKYFELSDFLPVVIEIENELGLISEFDFYEDYAVLTITNIDNINETRSYQTPVKAADVKGMLEIQQLGSQHTYLKRYLYYNYLNLTENDGVDGLDPKNPEVKDETDVFLEQFESRNKQAQKDITTWFDQALTKYGSREKIYELIGSNKESFTAEYYNTPKELLEQLKRFEVGEDNAE